MCSAQGAVSAYRKLTSSDGVKIILGPSCSGAMLGAAPLAEEDGVVLFSGMASNADIANAGDYIFRTQISDVEVGTLTGDLLWADGVRRLATITEATDYAEGTRSSTVSRFEQHGGQVVAAERYSSDITDFRSLLSKALAASPDAVHLAPQSEFAAGAIIKQARELGYDGPIYAETVSIGATALQIAGEAATGMKAIAADIHPGQPEGPGGYCRLQGTLRLRLASLAPGLHLRRCLHHRRVSAADRRRPGRGRLPRLPVRPHLERCNRPELQLRRERRGGRAVARRGPSAAAGGTHSRQELRGAGPSRRGNPVGPSPAAPRARFPCAPSCAVGQWKYGAKEVEP